MTALNRIRICIGLICLATTLRPGAAAAETATEPPLPPEMSELARLYRQHTSDINTRYRETIESIPSQYVGDLKALLARYQKSGDLEGVLSVAKEQKRFNEVMQAERDPFELTPEMPPAAIVKAPAELRQLQEQYVQRFQDAAEARQRDLKDLTAKYLTRLDAVQRELTIAGRIRDAVIVKNEADRLNKGIAGDDLAQLTEIMASEQLSGATATDGADDGTDVPVFGSVPNWAKWSFARICRFARERTQFDHPDVPDELDADYSPKTGRGRIYGRCMVDTMQVGPALSAWFGKALLWRVKDPATLTATIELESRQLSAGQEHGPHVHLAVLAAGAPLKVLNVPLMARQTTLRVVKDQHSNRCALMWPRGSITETFELPATGELSLLLAVTVRNPGELCDTSVELRP
ncbi:MAG: hypothetical protein PHR35_03595 [Kiritimatiellae bacterium]|nr:hypothetical protein [Kiritimatiellia bacterium]